MFSCVILYLTENTEMKLFLTNSPLPMCNQFVKIIIRKLYIYTLGFQICTLQPGGGVEGETTREGKRPYRCCYRHGWLLVGHRRLVGRDGGTCRRKQRNQRPLPRSGPPGAKRHAPYRPSPMEGRGAGGRGEGGGGAEGIRVRPRVASGEATRGEGQ